MIVAASIAPASVPSARRPDLAGVARAVGDPTRARMLALLMEGRSLVAKELAFGAGVEPATATAHLRRLEEARLLRWSRHGRNKIFRLASPEVARLVECLMVVAATPVSGVRLPPDPLRDARLCYDHLAGRLGIAVTDALLRRRHLIPQKDSFAVTDAGTRWFGKLGLDLEGLRALRRPLALRCLDWSERRDHLAGALGAALASRLVELGWIGRRRDSRAIAVTPAGKRGLAARLGVAPAAWLSLS